MAPRSDHLLEKIINQNEKILVSLDRLNTTMDTMRFQTVRKNGIVRSVRKESVRFGPAVMPDIVRRVLNAFLVGQAHTTTKSDIRTVMGYYDDKSTKLFINHLREEVHGMVGVDIECIPQPDGSIRISNPANANNKPLPRSSVSDFLDIYPRPSVVVLLSAF